MFLIYEYVKLEFIIFSNYGLLGNLISVFVSLNIDVIGGFSELLEIFFFFVNVDLFLILFMSNFRGDGSDGYYVVYIFLFMSFLLN